MNLRFIGQNKDVVVHVRARTYTWGAVICWFEQILGRAGTTKLNRISWILGRRKEKVKERVGESWVGHYAPSGGVVGKSVLKRKSSPQMCFAHLLKGEEDFLPIWLETRVCDGADKWYHTMLQKEKAITRVHKGTKRESLVTKLLKYSNVTVIWTSTPGYNFVNYCRISWKCVWLCILSLMCRMSIFPTKLGLN